ncbi:hypothetical protein F5Y16DRAFT_133034 [Xylariaceae sp. FL0255]|nr:hypothetical protein F5Y16DRAFT_133034 [Xylariaceae sp. FL0255]
MSRERSICSKTFAVALLCIAFVTRLGLIPKIDYQAKLGVLFMTRQAKHAMTCEGEMSLFLLPLSIRVASSFCVKCKMCLVTILDKC